MREPQFGALKIEILYKDLLNKMNTRLVVTDFGFEIHRRVSDNDPKSVFKQFGAGVGTTISNHLGRDLTPAEVTQVSSSGFVDVNL